MLTAAGAHNSLQKAQTGNSVDFLQEVCQFRCTHRSLSSFFEKKAVVHLPVESPGSLDEICQLSVENYFLRNDFVQVGQPGIVGGWCFLEARAVFPKCLLTTALFSLQQHKSRTPKEESQTDRAVARYCT